MHPFRVTVLGGTAFAVLAMLLPFASFPVVGAVDGISADAWPALLPLILLTILTLGARWDLGFSGGMAVLAVTAATTSLVFSVVKMTDAIVAVRSTAGATFGPGSVVLLIAVGVATAGASVGALART
jgi:hypothetical protein